MASIKKPTTRQDLHGNKMEVSKAKVGLGRANRTQAGSSRTNLVSVYSDNEAADTSLVSRKSIPANDASTASTSCQKGVQKSTEMSKGKNGSCGKAIARRRALADVSNVQSISSRNLARKSFIPLVSTNQGIKTTKVSSRKSIQGGQSQGVPDLHNSKKDLKASSSSQTTKATTLTRESIAANGRTKTRNSLIPTRTTARNSFIPRKSLPMLRRVNQADIPKENSGSSENAKGEVKVSVGRKVMPRVSNAKTHLWRNRVSDGFMIMNQRPVNSRTVSRKSVKPIVKTTVKASNAKLNMKSKPTMGPKKLVTEVTTLSKNKEPVTSSLCENITQESSCEQFPSGDSKPSTSDNVAKKSSRRRRSYTSLLMEGSKLLEEHDVVKQEKLPSIDDERNQLEVADYIDDIYQYYWVTEAQNPDLVNYTSIQTDISPHMRAVLINWLIEVHFKFDLMQETLYLMVTLLDRYLSQVTIKKSEMQLVGLTALLLASKYEDFWHPKVQDLLSISAESYTRDQMLEMEKLILRKLKFRLNTPTPYVFMLRFLKAAQSDTKLEHLAFYLIELCLVEYEALMFKPSLLCASAIFVARCTLQMTPWTPLLCRHARYEASQLRDCAEMILRFHQAARVGQLKVTYDKFMNPDLSGVAAIRPLDRLPL